jgi:5-formyltetrahydrofolate cyclo-ligase
MAKNISSSSKSEIRKNILYKRNSLSEYEIINNSKIISDRIILTKEYKNSKSIGAYYPTGSEVKTFDIIKHSIERKKEVGLPRVIDSTKIEFFKIMEDSFEKIKFTKGKYGIFENSTSTINMEKMDLLIIPGIAFDLQGNRLGYGKGYYDRFLSLRKVKYIIALAYETQVINEIPNNENDIPVDIIITEKRIINI